MLFDVAEVVPDEFVEAHRFAVFQAAFDGVSIFGDTFDGSREESGVDAPVVEDFFPMQAGVAVELHGTDLVVAGHLESALMSGGEEADMVIQAGVDHMAEQFDTAPATFAKRLLGVFGIHGRKRTVSLVDNLPEFCT